MINNIAIHVVCLAMAVTLTTPASAVVIIDKIRINDDGSIIFADKSVQNTATLQGPQGPTGPQGPQGVPGVVDKETLCRFYTDAKLVPPPICSRKVIFLTSQDFPPDLGGLAGADLKCQTAAIAAGLPGTFKAWLSDSKTSAKQRLTHHPGPYVRTDGAVVANSWTDLTDGWLKEAIFFNEYGISELEKWRYAWTGSDAYGNPYSYSYGAENQDYTCSDWTSNTTGWFVVGTAESIGSSWAMGSNNACATGYAFGLYCLEQ